MTKTRTDQGHLNGRTIEVPGESHGQQHTLTALLSAFHTASGDRASAQASARLALFRYRKSKARTVAAWIEYDTDERRRMEAASAELSALGEFLELLKIPQFFP